MINTKKKLVEGDCRENNLCVLIEDVMTTGNSIAQAAEMLAQENIFVKKIIVIVDRQDGGKEYLAWLRYKVEALLTIDDLIYCSRN